MLKNAICILQDMNSNAADCIQPD